MKNICNGKKSCEIEAKNKVFGDTCGGTYKYLEVVFECKSGTCFWLTGCCLYDLLYAFSEPRELEYVLHFHLYYGIWNSKPHVLKDDKLLSDIGDAI